MHLFATTMWSGGAISLFIVLLLSPSDTPDALNSKAGILRIIDHYVIGPGVVGSILTAFMYGTSTHFGFVKYSWVKIKWVLTIILVSFAIVSLLPLIGYYKNLAEKLMFAGSPEDVAQLRGTLQLCAIWIGILSVVQISILASHTIISVYRPGGRYLRKKREILSKNSSPYPCKSDNNPVPDNSCKQ